MHGRLSQSARQGTGLGLWLVYSVVDNHHGNIRLESELGSFTRFHVDFTTVPVGSDINQLHWVFRENPMRENLDDELRLSR